MPENSSPPDALKHGQDVYVLFAGDWLKGWVLVPELDGYCEVMINGMYLHEDRQHIHTEAEHITHLLVQ